MRLKIGNNSYFIFSFVNSPDELDQIEDSPYFKVNRQIIITKAKSIAVAVYGLPSFYSDNTKENKNIHLPYIKDIEARRIFCEAFKVFFQNYYNEQIAQVIVGHEHSRDKNKCYLQILIFFKGLFQKTILPGNFIIEDNEKPLLKDFIFVFIKQKCISKFSFQNYTKELNNFSFLYEKTQDINSNNEENNISSHWVINKDIFEKYPLIHKWFYQYAFPEGLRMRKALLLYSTKQFLGEFSFAKNLVDNESQYMIFDKVFDIIPEDKTPKLIIATNFSKFGPIQKSENKFYFNGETVYPWDYELPCIIISSDINFVLDCYFNEKLNKSIIFQEITERIGEYDIEEEFKEIEGDFTDGTKSELINESTTKSVFKFLRKKTKLEQFL